MIAPKGVEFINNPNTIEYQTFPEEYFSGSDVTIYMGDIFVSEVSGLQFVLEEKVLPVFGYASHTYDAVSRGTRSVQGSFSVPFREAGYLSTILSHIGEMTTADTQAKPSMAYDMGGQTVPTWNADVKETIEELINRVSNADMFKGKFPIGPGHKGEHIKIIRRLFAKTMGADPFGQNNPYSNWIKNHGGFTMANCQKISDTIYNHDKYGNSNTEFIKLMQDRITYLLHSGPKDKQRYASQYDFNGKPLMPLWSDGIIDTRTSKGMELFLTLFKYNTALKELKDSLDTSPQYAGQNIYKRMPAFALFALGSCPTEGNEDMFGSDLYNATVMWQMKKGRKVTGELTEDDVRELYKDAGDQYDNKNNGPVSNIEKNFADFEQEVWGRDFSDDKNHKYQTYFYTDRIAKQGIDHQEILKKKGFDIYITYGPSPEAIKANGNKIPDSFNFNTTVKAIRGIQLTSTGQTIMANGQPIEEVYTFLAKDLD